jgi:hypothetical protein
LTARLYPRSGNRKLGGLPASITSRDTCPDACSLKRFGCYALYGHTAAHWRRVGRQRETWDDFCADVARLPAGQLWRHNEAGDLPGRDDAVDVPRLVQLVAANRGRRGFTFSHYPVLDWRVDAHLRNAGAISGANRMGFTVNLSADDLAQADALADLVYVGPVAVLLPSDAPVRLKTPKGRRVVVCPAETNESVTCASCQLCANAGRKSVVGFRAHGQASQIVSEVARGRDPFRLRVVQA